MAKMLDLIEKLARGEAPPPAIATLIGFSLAAIEPGRALVEFEATERHANPMGTLHGGVLADIADAAMGMAYAALLDEGETFTTLELKINFTKPVWTGKLRAEGRVVSAGRTVVLGAAVLVPLARRGATAPIPRGLTPGQGARVLWIGALGFAAAFALSHWGIARSSATNAALLIVVEPLTLVVLGPLLLGERLTRREAAGAALAVAGAVLVVLNGVPGVTLEILPRWRGDTLLILSGIAYASYSLLGRTVLSDTNATVITARSIVWGMLVMAPLAALEWAAGARPVVPLSAVAGTLYLALVISAGAYLVWNWALARVEASRAAPFLTV